MATLSGKGWALISIHGKIMSAFPTHRKRKKTTIISYFQATWPSHHLARLDLHDSGIVRLASARTQPLNMFIIFKIEA
jgi:hypothetical protein